jgi:hypothetical protein
MNLPVEVENESSSSSSDDYYSGTVLKIIKGVYVF